ncbi:hypothetical protein Tco_0652398 [Tanacetum coccineum]|uniref:Uncharacterized protein n=1 Tax=Tanacetum coccineum TaxID=301880 RepID=A0ABQ4WXJ3_9ASTR
MATGKGTSNSLMAGFHQQQTVHHRTIHPRIILLQSIHHLGILLQIILHLDILRQLPPLRIHLHHRDLLIYHLLGVYGIAKPIVDGGLPPLSTMYPPTTSDSSAGDSSSESSSGPSRKRCRSPTATVTLLIPTLGALVPTRADLLPPRKRFRDSISLEDSIEEEIDVDVLAHIEADIASEEAAAGMDVKAVIDVGMSIKADVGVDREVKVEASASSTREIVVPIDSITEFETAQRKLEAGQLIASGERASLSNRTKSLERENLKVRRDRDDTRRRLRRLESFVARRMGFLP